jgi:hypothetical protein
MKAWRDSSIRCSSGFHSSHSMYSRGSKSMGKMMPVRKYSGSSVMRSNDRSRWRSWLITAPKIPKDVPNRISSRLTHSICSGWFGSTLNPSQPSSDSVKM